MDFKKLKDNLEKRGFKVYLAKNKKEAVKIALDLVPAEAYIGSGGSVTLQELDIKKVFRERKNKIQSTSLLSKSADDDSFDLRDMNWFITSSNAITMDGELVNTDGHANRIASMIYGPDNVLFFIGKNKIVKNLNAAFKRIHEVATPLNLERLNKRATGQTKIRTAKDIEKATLIMHAPSTGKSVHIILINEDLGY